MSFGPHLRTALDHCLKEGLTFAAFRQPDASVTLWAQRTPELDHVDASLLNELNEVFLLAPFNLVKDRIALVRSDTELTFSELIPTSTELLHSCTGSAVARDPVPGDTDAGTFRSWVTAAQEAMAHGALEKVVLSRTLSVPLDRALLAPLFIDALEDHPRALVALVHTPEHGTWLGASPERLVLAEDEHIRVDSVAATRRAENAPEDPRLWSPKEKREQDFVTLNIFSALLGLGVREIHVHGTEPLKTGGMVHLRSRIEADLDTCMLGDAVMALHPTPAVCGTPRESARSFIRTHEPQDRGLYAGFWGPWNADGRTELFVNIRCLQAFSERVVLHTGAGITNASDANKEWEETGIKTETWLKPLRTVQDALMAPRA